MKTCMSCGATLPTSPPRFPICESCAKRFTRKADERESNQTALFHKQEEAVYFAHKNAVTLLDGEYTPVELQGGWRTYWLRDCSGTGWIP